MKIRHSILIVLMMVATSSVFAANGNKTVTAAGTAEALVPSSQPFSSVTVCAKYNNTGRISVGDYGVVAALATMTGISLAADECYTIPAGEFGTTSDLRTVFVDATVSGDSVTFHSI